MAAMTGHRLSSLGSVQASLLADRERAESRRGLPPVAAEKASDAAQLVPSPLRPASARASPAAKLTHPVSRPAPQAPRPVKPAPYTRPSSALASLATKSVNVNRGAARTPSPSPAPSKKIQGKKDEISGLVESRWKAHLKNPKQDTVMPIAMVLQLLAKFDLYDDRVTRGMVRDYIEGGNGPESMVSRLHAVPFQGGINYMQFNALLQWMAAKKGITYAEVAQNVTEQGSGGLCGSSSVRKKLEIVFASFSGNVVPGRMHTNEFNKVCRKYDLDKKAGLTIGDVYLLYYKVDPKKSSVDFGGFLQLLAQVADKVDMGRQELLAFIVDKERQEELDRKMAADSRLHDASSGCLEAVASPSGAQMPKSPKSPSKTGKKSKASLVGRFSVSMVQPGWNYDSDSEEAISDDDDGNGYDD